ncbi:transmembrane protein 214-B [Photinus pyralis]|uniref:Transmembrane protein 214-A n=2 Tax=Photinus pyralis TaxID=7054 RepID=A0A1Y1NDD2_PHOPY|nr:transmembrane protein 214-B [Photinus pyralis]
MSSQWQVVGKKKSKEAVPVKKSEEKKKLFASTPKIEEVLPLQQVKNLYNASKNNENPKQQAKPKTQENGVKKPQKKPDKPQSSPKPKPPKSIESALNSIDIEELKVLINERQRLFPDAPLVCLKDVVKFLSQQIPVEVSDHTFSSHPDGYPCSIIPNPLKLMLETPLKGIGRSNLQVFFDLLLTSMTNDMSKNVHTLGTKIYIQLVALMEPSLVLASLNKHASLRTSYQNRPPIGLSILWGLGQAGIKDLHAGLKVFQEIMLPIIEMKSFSRYIVKYLISLINRHGSGDINIDQYLLILDVAFANYKNVPNDLKSDLQKVVPKLESMLLGNKEKLHTFVDPLIKKLLSNGTKAYRDEICKILIRCFTQDQNAISSWSKMYSKYLPQSAILLNYLSEKWSSLSGKFNKTALVNLLNTFAATNEELLTKKRKEPGLSDSIAVIKRLKNKMTPKKRSKGFPYRFWTIILIGAIAGVLYYDINQHGSWPKSRTFNCLKDFGVIQYYHKALHRTSDGLYWLHLRVNEQIPGYYETVSEHVAPYGQLAKELSVIVCNLLKNFKDAIIKKYPDVLASIEAYAPGLVEHSQEALRNAWSASVFYAHRSVDYLKTEVFVGQLAPENMQRVVFEAFNNTQHKAAEYYSWIYEKVQSSIK